MVSSSRQSQTELNHFQACLVGGALFPFHLIVSRSVGGDGHPLLRQELHGRACYGKVLVETAPDHLEIFQLTAAAPWDAEPCGRRMAYTMKTVSLMVGCMFWMMPLKIRICSTGEDSSWEQDPHDMRRGKNFSWGSNVDLVLSSRQRLIA
jgi:hypothetical protein